MFFVPLLKILFQNVVLGLCSVKRDDGFVCRSRKRRKWGKTMTCSLTKAATCPPTSTSNSRRSSSQPATTSHHRQHNNNNSNNNNPFSRTRLPPPASPSSIHPPSKTPPTRTPTRTRLRHLRPPRSRTTRCTSCPTASLPSHLPTRSTTSWTRVRVPAPARVRANSRWRTRRQGRMRRASPGSPRTGTAAWSDRRGEKIKKCDSVAGDSFFGTVGLLTHLVLSVLIGDWTTKWQWGMDGGGGWSGRENARPFYMPYRQLIVCVFVYSCILLSLPNLPLCCFLPCPSSSRSFERQCVSSVQLVCIWAFPCHSGNVRVERKKNKKRTALLIRQVDLESLCRRQCFWSSVWGSCCCCCCCFTTTPCGQLPPPSWMICYVDFSTMHSFFLFFSPSFCFVCVRACLSTLEAPQNGCCRRSCRQLEKFLSWRFLCALYVLSVCFLRLLPGVSLVPVCVDGHQILETIVWNQCVLQFGCVTK